MRFLTGGESHGRQITAIVEGFPANVPIDRDEMAAFMARRRLAPGRGGRMRVEDDCVRILSGLVAGKTLGSPITLAIENRDWQNWAEDMDPWQRPRLAPVTVPRPGHADLPGYVKYRLEDMRLVAERASARETAARTAVGCLALQLLAQLAVAVSSQVLCPDQATIAAAQQRGDTVGGVFSVTISGLPAGVGSYVHWDRRLDARLAAALMSIPGVKGVDFGHAFANIHLPGSQYHDAFVLQQGGYCRSGNAAGGVEGGMSSGQPIVLRCAVKPVPTLDQPLASFDVKSGRPVPAPVSRHDTCAVGAAAVVAEALCAWEVAVLLMEQFGGDSYCQLVSRLEEYRQQWQQVMRWRG